MKQSRAVEQSKLNKSLAQSYMAVLSLIAGLVVLTIIVIAWINASNTASNTAKQAAATDPLDPRYWTPERIALSHARADAVQHGKVLIGMYAADCRSAWGTPEKVDKTTTANGVSEWWWYRDGRGFASFYDGSDPNGIRTRVTNASLLPNDFPS
jgi:hypothetical protein